MPSLSLVELTAGNRMHHGFHEILNKTKLDMKRRSRTFFMATSEILCAPFSRNESSSSLPVFLLVVLEHSRLYHRQRIQQCFVMPACTPLMRPMTLKSPQRFYWYILQKELHIAIRLFQMNWLGKGNPGIFILIVFLHSFQTSLRRIYEKLPMDVNRLETFFAVSCRRMNQTPCSMSWNCWSLHLSWPDSTASAGIPGTLLLR